MISFQALLLAQEVKFKVTNPDVDRTTVEFTITGNKIMVENAPVGKKIEIFSIIGLKVTEIEFKNPTAEYILNIPKGYYILKFGETVRKIAIR